jgi:hypothetical protein
MKLLGVSIAGHTYHVPRGRACRAARAVRAWRNMKMRMGLVLTTIIGVCAVLSGCKDDPTTWSAESRSPDGHWLALAHTVQHSGPGTDGVETIVEIKRTNGLRSSTRVLAFANDGASMSLKINWMAPSHLEVTFKDDPKMLYFQVVKTSGIDISVRDLSTELDGASNL